MNKNSLFHELPMDTIVFNKDLNIVFQKSVYFPDMSELSEMQVKEREALMIAARKISNGKLKEHLSSVSLRGSKAAFEVIGFPLSGKRPEGTGTFMFIKQKNLTLAEFEANIYSEKRKFELLRDLSKRYILKGRNFLHIFNQISRDQRKENSLFLKKYEKK